MYVYPRSLVPSHSLLVGSSRKKLLNCEITLNMDNVNVSINQTEQVSTLYVARFTMKK